MAPEYTECLPKQYEYLYIPHVSVIAIVFITILVIAVISIQYLRAMSKLTNSIKFLFYISVTAACIAEIFHMMTVISCWLSLNTEYINIVRVMHFTGYILLGFTLLWTLNARLYFTFRDSAYKLSTSNTVIIFTLNIILIIIAILVICFNAFAMTEYFGLILAFISFIVYSIATIHSIVVFLRNLMKLVQLRASSVRDVMDKEALTLNQSQTKMINQITRYVSLLGLAIFSSGLTGLGALIIVVYDHWLTEYAKSIQLSIDVCINILLLSLQYPFANHYYEKYCQCTKKLWNLILMNKAQHDMQKKYNASLQFAEQKKTENV